VALYGGALGATAVLVALVAHARLLPPLYEPERLALLPSVFLSSAGVVSGALVAFLLVSWLIKGTGYPQHPLVWLTFGVGFGIMVPFGTGALTPVSIVFLNLHLGVIAPGEILPGLVEAAFRAPQSAFSYSGMSFASTALATVLFGPGAWLIDTANGSRNVIVSRYGVWAVALALSFGFVALANLVPASTLVKLG